MSLIEKALRIVSGDSKPQVPLTDFVHPTGDLGAYLKTVFDKRDGTSVFQTPHGGVTIDFSCRVIIPDVNNYKPTLK